MKKTTCLFLVIILIFSLSACRTTKNLSSPESTLIDGTTSLFSTSISAETQSESTDISSYEHIDIDLTKLSSTMVYSEVYNMMVSPEKYQAKCIKMDGMFNFYQDPETGNCYFACIISDATACCSQGLEFVLSGDYKYPDDYPPVNSEITVTGIFETFLLPPCFYCNTDSLLSMA